MLIQVAKALGAEVATTVRDDAKGEFAEQAGADLVINARTEDIVERVKEWTGGQGADVVIDNLAGDVLAKSIEAAKAQGVVVAFGFAAGPEVSFDIRSLFFAQKQIKGTMASDIEDLEWGLAEVPLICFGVWIHANPSGQGAGRRGRHHGARRCQGRIRRTGGR